MMRKSLWLTAILLLLFSVVYSQSREIRGKIVDAVTGEPVPGATIMTDKKKFATAAADGSYSIQVASGTKSLIFSNVGYETLTVDLKDGATYDIRLQPAA